MTRHALEASAAPTRCATCHAPETCDSCHVERGVSGVVLFGRNVQSAQQVAELCAELKANAIIEDHRRSRALDCRAFHNTAHRRMIDGLPVIRTAIGDKSARQHRALRYCVGLSVYTTKAGENKQSSL